MISRPPFNTWPLHVKLFTPEADQHWKASVINDLAPPLPPGFTCTLELEGVDGKSGHVGSGRQGPISVNDGKLFPSISSSNIYFSPIEEFTATMFAKATAVVAASGNIECTICHQPILNFDVVGLICLSIPSPKFSRLTEPLNDSIVSIVKLPCRFSFKMSVPRFHQSGKSANNYGSSRRGL